MLAAYASRIDPRDPLSALIVGEHAEPAIRDGWTIVTLKTAALNHHDLWTLRGVGISQERIPMILGCDGAGVDEYGNEVIIHPVIASPGWSGDETLDPRRTILSEKYPGTLAQKISVPSANLVSKPENLSWEHAACMPTAWLTAYRMLFTRGQAQPGQTVLVQGASGGVSEASIALASAAGLRVWVTGRSEQKREAAMKFGADAIFTPGAALPDRVDIVIDTVGDATWDHSIKSLRSGGILVTSGATSGHRSTTDLRHVYFRQLQILGSTMGTRAELEQLLAFATHKELRPTIDSTFALADSHSALAKLAEGDVIGKIVLTTP